MAVMVGRISALIINFGPIPNRGEISKLVALLVDPAVDEPTPFIVMFALYRGKAKRLTQASVTKDACEPESRSIRHGCISPRASVTCTIAVGSSEWKVG